MSVAPVTTQRSARRGPNSNNGHAACYADISGGSTSTSRNAKVRPRALTKSSRNSAASTRSSRPRASLISCAHLVGRSSGRAPLKVVFPLASPSGACGMRSASTLISRPCWAESRANCRHAPVLPLSCRATTASRSDSKQRRRKRRVPPRATRLLPSRIRAAERYVRGASAIRVRRRRAFAHAFLDMMTSRSLRAPLPRLARWQSAIVPRSASENSWSPRYARVARRARDLGSFHLVRADPHLESALRVASSRRRVPIRSIRRPHRRCERHG